MANNLFISYDLNSPGQDYTNAIKEIQTLGKWAAVQKSLWYVISTLTAQQAAERVWAKMDSNDSLIVIDTTNNDAYSFNVEQKVVEHIRNNWNHQ